jgi:hypothetical protein
MRLFAASYTDLDFFSPLRFVIFYYFYKAPSEVGAACHLEMGCTAVLSICSSGRRLAYTPARLRS